MNILVCYPWLDIGGAPNTAITLARGLKERGHGVYFFTKEGGAYEKKLREAGIPVISAPYDPLLPALYHLNPRAYRLLSRALDEHRIDVIHAFHYSPYLLSLFAAAARNIPVIFTAVWFLNDGPYPAYPGRVIFVAEEFLDRAKPLFKGRLREMLVMPNRVDLDQFRPGIDASAFAAAHDLPAEGWKIAFMSRIDSIKIGSIRYAIEGARILAARGRDVRLAIAGSGPFFDEMNALAAGVNRELGRTVVSMVGSITETPQFLSWADIVLGIGRSTFEGMACGKPTFVVGEKGLAGVVEPASAHTLQYYNFAGRNLKEPAAPGLLADAIDALMNDRTRYAELASFARAYVMENYDYRAGAERLEKLYDNALADPPLTRGERAKLFWTNLAVASGYRAYIALRLRARELLGIRRPPSPPAE